MKEKHFTITPSFLLPLFLLFAKSPLSELLLFLGAILLHEMGHLAALLHFGIRPKQLTLSCLGAQIEMCDPYLAYKKEAHVFLAGPLAGFLGCILAWLFLRYHFTRYGMLFFSFNLLLSLFNLLPLKSLDGGKALFSLLCHYGEESTAQKITNWVHLVTLALLLLISLWIMKREKNASLFILTLIFAAKEKKPRSPRSFFTRSLTQQH